MAPGPVRSRNGLTTPPASAGPPGRRRHVGLVSGGALLVLGAALLGALLFTRSGEMATVVVAARDVPAGQALVEADFELVEVPADSALVGVSGDDAGLLPGLVAVGPIPAGSVVHPEAVADATTVAEGAAVVSAVLEPGAFPGSVRAGSRVVVVDGTGGLGEATVISVALFDVSPASGAVVTLEVADADAEAVAVAAGGGALRLVLVGGVGPVGGD